MSEREILVCESCGSKIEIRESILVEPIQIDPEALKALFSTIQRSGHEQKVDKATAKSATARRYHVRYEPRGAGGGRIGCHMVQVKCGPLRKQNEADAYLEQLEHAFGPLC